MLFSKFEIDNNQLKKIVTVNYRTDNEGNNIRHTVIPYLPEKTYQSFTSDCHYQ
jgi:phosphatidate phosphatase APP1